MPRGKRRGRAPMPMGRRRNATSAALVPFKPRASHTVAGLGTLRPTGFIGGGPLSIDGAQRMASGGIVLPPPARTRLSLAQRGKRAAQAVKRHNGRTALVGGAMITAASVARSSGRSTDRTRGRPTGIYGY